MKDSGRLKTVYTVFGGLFAIAMIISLYAFFSLAPNVETFAALGELAARLTSGELDTEKHTVSSPPQEETAFEIRPTQRNDGVFQGLISLSGLEYEFWSEDESASMPDVGQSPEHQSGPIERKTYSYKPSGSIIELPFGGLLRNCTDISNDYLLEQAEKEPAQKISDPSAPTVLIMHTHTTESYEKGTFEFYSEYNPSRSTDPSQTVVAVGEKIAEKLSSAGIGVIHLKEEFDYPEYSGAYDRSCERVIEILDQNPTVQIVIDVHRDAIESDGVRYAPVAEIGGKTSAQVMIICGCKNVPQYRYNLRLASRLQGIMEQNYSGLTRPILFDERNYNQELTKGSILLEMGSHANSLDEALYCGELVGECLKQLVFELSNE